MSDNATNVQSNVSTQNVNTNTENQNLNTNTDVKTQDSNTNQDVNLENINLEIKDNVKTETKETLFERGEDPSLNLLFDYVEKQGFKPGDEAIEKALDGDFTLIEQELKKKGVTDYKDYILLAKKAFEVEAEKAKQVVEATKKEILSVIGNEEKLKAVQDFVREHADAKEKQLINNAINTDPFLAKVIYTYLNSLYDAHATNILPKNPAEKNAVSESVSTKYGLTKQEYFLEVEQLAKKVGGSNIANHPAYQELVKRREYGVKQGL